MKSTYSEKYQALLVLLVTERKARGITQAALAEKLQQPQSFVSKIENGERRLDVIEFLEMANHLSIDPCEVIQKLQGLTY